MQKRLARDVMTAKVVTVDDMLPVAEFARLLSENQISGAPVVSRRGLLVGVASATDIVSHELKVGHVVVSESEYYARPDLGTREEMRALGVHLEDYGDSLVRDIMTPVVISAPPDATVAELAERMAVNRVHRLLITEGDTLLGVVSALDLLGLIPDAATRVGGSTSSEVIWATDLGPDAERIGRQAIRLAIDSDARVTVLHVTPKLDVLMGAYGDRPELVSLQKDLEETTLLKLRDLGGNLLEGTVLYEIVARAGNPAEIILEEIAKRRPRFVVIGSRRPPEARIEKLGSVADQVLRRSRAIVVTVPPVDPS